MISLVLSIFCLIDLLNFICFLKKYYCIERENKISLQKTEKSSLVHQKGISQIQVNEIESNLSNRPYFQKSRNLN